MKVSNKGITLSETLCYIIIFTLLIIVISSYSIYINKYYVKKDNTTVDEITFIETLCNNINDYKFINKEELFFYINNEEEIIIKGCQTEQVYLQYQYSNQKLYNGLLGKSIIINNLDIQFIIRNSYLLITNKTNNYYFIVEVEK